MNIFDAIVLGIVEGLSEFLPISSTGHLVLTANVLGIGESSFTKSFEIAIQLGAILAVVVLYGRARFFDWNILKRLVIAFVPTGLMGLLFYKTVKHLLGSPIVAVATLFFGGVILILFERWHREREDVTTDLTSISYLTAVKLGLFQALAIVPGVSRSGATIVGGMLLGLSRSAVVEFSFLLAVPTMVVATVYDLLKNAAAFATAEWHLMLVGFVVSFLVALGAIRWFVRFVGEHSFVAFGCYRIVIALIFFWYMV